jgi:hypothetical protein
MNDIVDRFQCTLDGLRWECKYLFAKLRLLQVYVSIYENTVDSVEAYRLCQRMLDIKDSIPLLDPESFYFKDSYQLQIRILQQER